MLSQSQFVTPPNRGTGGAGGLREGLLPRGPQELFGGGGQGDTPWTHYSPLATSPQSPYSPAPAAASQSRQQSPGSPALYPAPAPGPSPPPGQTVLAGRVEVALSLPSLAGRAVELTPLLDSCPPAQLAGVWARVVNSVFQTWGIATTHRSAQPRDYMALAAFLAPTGPLLAAANRLLSDPYARYEFPVSRLPGRAASAPALAGRISPLALAIPLTSWEFYMLNFAVELVKPGAGDGRLVAGESLYPLLLEDYLAHHLPCDGTTPPPLPSPASHQESPPPAPSPAPASTVSPPRRSLLRQPWASGQGRSTAAVVTPAPAPPVAGDQTWTSETLLSLLTAVWLPQFAPGAEAAFPQSDTLKIVRMLIKHLHYFSNSGGPVDVTPLDRLKRSTLPSLRPQLYSLFKQIFTQWPHDTSFRLVLETWLSYIQPWRYTDRTRPVADSEAAAPVEASRWQRWAQENLPFYSEIFRLLLPRLLRMDLTSSKNAYMLFRVAKVMGQPGLGELLQAVEAGGGEVVAGAGELEPLGTALRPLYSRPALQEVGQVLGAAHQALTAATQQLEETGQGRGTAGSGWGWAGLQDWLAGPGPGAAQLSQETEELRKAVQHLTASITAFTATFGVEVPAGADRTDRAGAPGGAGSGHSPGLPETEQTEQGAVLTPHGRWQVVQGLARPRPTYQGDPDMRPIGGSEVAWLVRLLHRAATGLNTRHGDRLEEVWRSGGVAGQLARLLLAPPTTCYTLERRPGGGPPSRRPAHLPARVLLRPLASKRHLAWLGCYLALARLIGRGPVPALLLLLVLATLAYLAIALVRHLSDRPTALLDTSDLDWGTADKKTN